MSRKWTNSGKRANSKRLGTHRPMRSGSHGKGIDRKLKAAKRKRSLPRMPIWKYSDWRPSNDS